jgi:predicted permease
MRGGALVAVTGLAVGIAATTTMFTAAYAALLRPVPFADPDRLVLLFTTHTDPRDGLVLTRWSRALIDTLTGSVTSYEALASCSSTLINISGGNGDPEQIEGEVVSPEYFSVLSVRPNRGRTFMAAEDDPAGDVAVAVLSERLWRRRYGAEPSLIGGTVRINDVPLTVVGIMPAAFSGLGDKAEIWIPRAMAPRLTYADYLTTPQLFIPVIGRLKPGVTVARANAELAALSAALPGQRALDGARPGAVARRIGEVRVDPSVRRSVLLLLSAAGCVLLIVCANVAALALARGRGRRRELAIRMTIGSGRGRIAGQLLTESLLLASVAGAAGTILALWGVDLLARYAPVAVTTGRTVVSAFSVPAFDAGALLFAVGATLVTSVACGVAPAFDAWRLPLTSALREDERGGGLRRRVFPVLVVTEVTFAVALLVAAGVLLDSVAKVLQLRRGFATEGVLTFWVRPPVSRYPVTKGPETVERLLASVERVPGVETAAVNRCTPFSGCSRTVVFFSDRPNDPDNAPVVGRHYASADYFVTLGIPLLAGRALSRDDRPGRPPVAVINESAARRFWPGRSPIGEHVWFGGTTGPFADPAHGVEIVGIVGDVKYEAVDWPGAEGRPEFYTSYLQFSYPDTMVIVKARGSTAALVPALRRAIASVDSALPIYDVLTLDERIDAATARTRFNAGIVTGFAGVALLVAALGIYGILSYSVSTRTRELGVRLALGAQPAGVVKLVLGEGLKLGTIGLATGVAVALGTGRLMQNLLVGVGEIHPMLVAAVALMMLAVTSLASWLPARRAAGLDPVTVLRQE